MAETSEFLESGQLIVYGMRRDQKSRNEGDRSLYISLLWRKGEKGDTVIADWTE